MSANKSNSLRSLLLTIPPLCAKLTYKKHRHSYSCVQTRTNVYGRVWAMFWTIFDRTDMTISLHRVGFRVEFDGDVRFFIAPPKSMFLSLSIDFFDVFCNFFLFQVFAKILIFFSVPPPSQNLCRCRRRGTEPLPPPRLPWRFIS